MTINKTTYSAEETLHFGEKIGKLLIPGSVITLNGDLGTGKTTLIQGICAGLDVKDVVTSPTFTLVQEYTGRMPVFHFDFYRLASEDDVWNLDFISYLEAGGACMIEWPELSVPMLPKHVIKIDINRDQRIEHEFWNIRYFIIETNNSDIILQVS